jgi:parvulin-like peptidyl-prolyl isomerase
MRYFFIAAICLCSGLFARANVVNGVYVIVNDSVITYDQVESEILPMVETLATQYRSDPKGFDQKLQQIRREKLEQLVEDRLILHEFKTAGYVISESFLDDRIKDRIKKEYYGDRARLTRSLQQRGMSYEMYYQQERERYIILALSEKYLSMDKVLISPAKIEEYYNTHTNAYKVDDQVKLRMIVINQPSGAEPGQARKIAGEVLQLVDQGASFAELAGVYSAGSQRADGGNRGWVDRSYFKPELAKVAFSLKPGQHSGVVEMGDACFLLLVEDVRPAHIRTLADVRQDVENTLKDQEKRRLKDRWIGRLKAKSFVRIFN